MMRLFVDLFIYPTWDSYRVLGVLLFCNKFVDFPAFISLNRFSFPFSSDAHITCMLLGLKSSHIPRLCSFFPSFLSAVNLPLFITSSASSSLLSLSSECNTFQLQNFYLALNTAL
jgi:hypothetical protein